MDEQIAWMRLVTVYYYVMQAVNQLLAWSPDIVRAHVKNLEGKTAWDILQEQTQIDNNEIKVLLRDAKSLT